MTTPTLADTVRLAARDHIYSCHDCSWGEHLDTSDLWRNDPSEAWFKCHLGLGENPERQWGEYPPCEHRHIDAGAAARVWAVLERFGVLPTPENVECQTCGGVGIVGGVDEWDAYCPNCTQGNVEEPT